MTARTLIEAESATRRYTRRHAREIVTAMLGNNAGTVIAAVDTRWFWIRLHGDSSQVVRAWNMGFVPPVNNLPVDIEIVRGNGITSYQILGVSINPGAVADVYANATGMHALQHQRRDFNLGGYDPLDIYARALIPLRARAQTTPDMTLYVEPGFYAMNGVISYWAGGNSAAFVAPGGGLRIDLLYLNATGTLAVVTGTVAPLSPPYPTTPTTGAIPIAYIHLIATTTAVTEYLIEDARVLFGTSGAANTNALLDGLVHTDTLAGAVVDGDIIIGNVTPKWSRLAVAIPAANVRNVLGIDNAELRPSWKTALDATGPADIANAGAAGTSLVFSHRDHAHKGVVSVNKNGGATLYGAVTLSQGANITLTQTGQDIEIAGAAGAPLTVEELDAAPSVANVIKIKVPNGSLTDDGGGVVTFSPAGTGDVVGPAGATDGNLAVFDGATGKLLKDGGAPAGGGNVSDTGATTANHLAVWNGASDHIIKDGGAVVSPTYPTHATMFHDESKVTAGNAFTFALSTADKYNFDVYQNAPADHDTFTQTFVLAAGTYSFSVMGIIGTDQGKIDWSVDGGAIVSAQDWYNGSTVRNTVKTVGSITIATDGVHTLQGYTNGKNGSGSNYYKQLQKYWFWL